MIDAHLEYQLACVREERDAANQRIAALEADKERLDWLEVYVEDGGRNGLITNLTANGQRNIREAIDTVRAALAKDSAPGHNA